MPPTAAEKCSSNGPPTETIPDNECVPDDGNVKVREYVSPAVYIETTYQVKANKQNIYIPGSGDHPKTVKRCVCFTSPDECPCHPCTSTSSDSHEGVVTSTKATSLTSLPSSSTSKTRNTTEHLRVRSAASLHHCTSTVILEEQDEMTTGDDDALKDEVLSKSPSDSAQPLTPSTNSIVENESDVTVRATTSTSDLRLSIPSLTSVGTSRCFDESVREENFRQWCMRKDAERRMQEEREELIQKIKEQQRQAVVELERENFKRWLDEKKKREDEMRKNKSLKEEAERLKEEERRKRMLESELSYQIWLKKKEEKDLEKKIKKQLTLIEREEQKQRRLEYSEKAYNIWKKHAKNRQKPVPFGLGIETLKSSASVAYINPQPWVPNIDLKEKPHSK